MIETIHFTLNNEPQELAVDVCCSLADLLRDQCGITSVKQGCGSGACGGCTVLVDGRAIDSCLYLAVWAKGRNILTVEGLKQGNCLHPIQQAFIDEAAVQCGFCTPGIIMSAVEALSEGRIYTRQELRQLISGHLCRCTGYENIINALEKAMYLMYGEKAKEGSAK